VVYTGDGKGKTTAALGLAFRALGRGLRVAVLQFVKGDRETGERRLAERGHDGAGGLAGLDWQVLGEGFTWLGDDPSVHADAARAGWARASALLAEGRHDVVILDEVILPVARGWIDLADLLAVLSRRRPGVHVVLTGRGAPPALVDAADLVTDMRAVKHPFEKGVRAIAGVDF
jgi:cob(I)alamin adenosyltransferase